MRLRIGFSKKAALVARGMIVVGALTTGSMARAQNKLGPAAPVTYDNRYEVYGGVNFMNFQAGQTLPKRMNFAGGELMGTYWLTKKIGLGLDYRGEAGTTPVLPNPYVNNRPLVYMNMLMAGGQYRGPKNRYAAVDYHAFFGASDGIFTYSTKDVPVGSYKLTGLYTNRTKPIGAVGGSIDFNRSKNFAVRLQPDLIFEHFGSETREFFSISGGIVYRIGKR